MNSEAEVLAVSTMDALAAKDWWGSPRITRLVDAASSVEVRVAVPVKALAVGLKVSFGTADPPKKDCPPLVDVSEGVEASCVIVREGAWDKVECGNWLDLLVMALHI